MRMVVYVSVGGAVLAGGPPYRANPSWEQGRDRWAVYDRSWQYVEGNMTEGQAKARARQLNRQ